MFYEFRQNNSGGSFEIDEQAGISIHVIVEADTLTDAEEKAQNIGVYFDGIEKGYDCACCGDRWYRPWDESGDAVPSRYGVPLLEANATREKWRTNWAGDKPETFIHYSDGSVEAVFY